SLEKVVAGQIDCFGRDDYEGALAFAEPRFRESWSPENFRAMVAGAYQPLTLRYRATFGRGRVTDSSATLPVTLLSGDGEKVLYAYSLARVDGKWYVAGVAPTGPAPGSRGVPSGPGRPGLPAAGDVREL
ncbi:MAG TPA: DUF4864 domain-containing protein, partial [Armatimonadaceae bacterium]|nr:DUF4864 domain-containing protein [Armatimonadaceae bacterium]